MDFVVCRDTSQGEPYRQDAYRLDFCPVGSRGMLFRRQKVLWKLLHVAKKLEPTYADISSRVRQGFYSGDVVGLSQQLDFRRTVH